MDKEKILQMAREENNDQDLVEQQVKVKSEALAYAVGGALCFVLMLLQNIITGEAELSCAIIYLGMATTRLFMRYQLTKQRKELVFAIIMAFLTVTGIVVHVCNLLLGGI